MNTRQRIEAKAKASQEGALAAFIARKAEIDTMLARLTALSADHFDTSPAEHPLDVGQHGGGVEATRAARLRQAAPAAAAEVEAVPVEDTRGSRVGRGEFGEGCGRIHRCLRPLSGHAACRASNPCFQA